MCHAFRFFEPKSRLGLVFCPYYFLHKVVAAETRDGVSDPDKPDPRVASRSREGRHVSRHARGLPINKAVRPVKHLLSSTLSGRDVRDGERGERQSVAHRAAAVRAGGRTDPAVERRKRRRRLAGDQPARALRLGARAALGVEARALFPHPARHARAAQAAAAAETARAARETANGGGGGDATNSENFNKVMRMIQVMPTEEFKTPAELQHAAIGELKERLKRRDVAYAGCVERNELVDLLVEFRGGPSNNDTCCICCEEYQSGDVMRLLRKCKHEFHLECLDKWAFSSVNLQRLPSCPLCNQALE